MSLISKCLCFASVQHIYAQHLRGTIIFNGCGMVSNDAFCKHKGVYWGTPLKLKLKRTNSKKKFKSNEKQITYTCTLYILNSNFYASVLHKGKWKFRIWRKWNFFKTKNNWKSWSPVLNIIYISEIFLSNITKICK